MVNIVAAMSKNRVIGNKGMIPWRVKADLIHLKKLMKNNTVIMGRKTYESMQKYYVQTGRDFPSKNTIIVSRSLSQDEIKKENTFVFENIDTAINKAKEYKEETYIIGGGEIFKEALEKDLVDRMYLTIIKEEFEGDTFFPEYDESIWRLVDTEILEDEKYEVVVKLYERKNS